MSKKFFLLIILLLSLFGVDVYAAEILQAREYLSYGTFDEAGSPEEGYAFAEGSPFNKGWSSYKNVGKGAYIVNGADNPFGSGKGVRLIQDTENTTTLYFQSAYLNDADKGTDYTNTRALELDFNFKGKKGGSSASLIRHALSIAANSDGKTASLRLYCGNVDTGGPGVNYTTIKTDITMNENHHLKFVYRITNSTDEGYEAGGDARSVAVYIDGEKVANSHIGDYINKDISLNYYRKSSSSSQSGFQIGFWETATSDELSQEFYFDNFRYYGLTQSLDVLDENNILANDGDVIERTARFKLDAILEGTDSDALITSAFYDKNGKLLTFNNQKTINISKQKTQSIEVPVKIPDEIATDTVKVKAFLWQKDALTPLCIKETICLNVSDSFEKTLARLKQNVMNELYSSSAKSDTILEKMNDDGSFSDLDYADRRRSVWDPATHFSRLTTLCRAYSSPENPEFGNLSLREATYKSLYFWFNHDPALKCNNWWYNDVQIPAYCYEFLLLDDNLPADLRAIMQERLNKSRLLADRSSKVGTLRDYSRSGTALPRAAYYTVGSVLCDDTKTDSEKINQIYDILDMVNFEILLVPYAYGKNESGEVTDTECIKADFSYHEHENMLLAASYGWGDLNHIYEFLSILNGSNFELSFEAKERLGDVMLDGFGYMGFKNKWDTTVLGRAIADKSNVSCSSTQEGLMKYLLKDDNITRRAELESRIKRMKYPSQNDNFTGNRHFWQSDFTSHNRKNYHFSVKTASTRTRTTEGINGENIIGKYLSDGVINLVKRGSEYEDLAPVWDWNKLPGTTTVQGKTDTELFPTGRPMGTKDFVGGVSDGTYGFSVFDYERDGVTAKKSYFCFDDEIVMLGAGITSNEENSVFTSVNQCAKFGDALVSVNGNTKTVTESENINGIGYVLHDGVGYIFKGDENITVKNEAVTGSWSRVNTALSTDEVADEVFLVGIDHGVKPNNAKYEVVILPETTQEALNAYESKISVLSNTEALQAVWHSALNRLQAVFYEAGSLNLPNGVNLSVDSPCALMTEFSDGAYKIYIQNPTNEALETAVTLSGGIAKTVKFSEGVGERGNDGGKTYFYDSKTEEIIGRK